MSSGNPVTPHQYKSIRKGTEFLSERYKVADVLRGVERCLSSKDVDSITRIKLTFDIHLRVNGAETRQTGDSGWLDLSEALREHIRTSAIQHEAQSRKKS